MYQYRVGYSSLAMTALLVICWTMPSAAQTRQAHVHHMSHEVMPFHMAETQHIFTMIEQVGVLRVLGRNADAKDKIALIQQHLQHDATRFQQGDYSDPAALHGKDMPGLKELAASASKVKVSYTALPDGGAITFTTKRMSANGSAVADEFDLAMDLARRRGKEPPNLEIPNEASA